MGKRKRDQNTASQAEEPSRETPSTTTASEVEGDDKKPPVAIIPFTVQTFPSSKNNKQKREGSSSKNLSQAPITHGALACSYRVSPSSKWEGMKKYNRFVVLDRQFGVGDYVYILHGEPHQDSELDPINQNCWVAQVLEVRAIDEKQVYLRVFWMYWPEELPNGRESYHGKYELVSSNHMEILDATTVTDRADVVHLDENDVTPTNDLYWRQNFDTHSNKLSALKRDCYCKSFHNPERLLIQCPHCHRYLHEQCLLRDACSRAWYAEQNRNTITVSSPLPRSPVKSSPVAIRSTAPDSQKTISSNDTQESLPPPPTPASRAHKKQKVLEDPWDGKMVAHLEMKTTQGEETTEATGNANVTCDFVGEVPQDIKIGLRCLMPGCGKWMYDESSSFNERGSLDEVQLKSPRRTKFDISLKDDSDVGNTTKKQSLNMSNGA